MKNIITPSEYTPGDWSVVTPGGSGVQKLIMAEEGSLLAIVGAFPDSDLREVSANARLIAAAPVLFERLSALRDYLDAFFEEYARLDHGIKRAIAASTCPIARLEHSIAEIDAVLAQASPGHHA